MRDYVRGFVIGAVFAATLAIGSATADTATYGNFVPTIQFDGASRVIDLTGE